MVSADIRLSTWRTALSTAYWSSLSWFDALEALLMTGCCTLLIHGFRLSVEPMLKGIPTDFSISDGTAPVPDPAYHIDYLLSLSLALSHAECAW